MKRIYAKEMTRNQMRRLLCIGVVPAMDDIGLSDSELYEKHKDKLNGRSLEQYEIDFMKEYKNKKHGI